jgi:hypothetical protein
MEIQVKIKGLECSFKLCYSNGVMEQMGARPHCGCATIMSALSECDRYISHTYTASLYLQQIPPSHWSTSVLE